MNEDLLPLTHFKLPFHISKQITNHEGYACWLLLLALETHKDSNRKSLIPRSQLCMYIDRQSDYLESASYSSTSCIPGGNNSSPVDWMNELKSTVNHIVLTAKTCAHLQHTNIHNYKHTDTIIHTNTCHKYNTHYFST